MYYSKQKKEIFNQWSLKNGITSLFSIVIILCKLINTCILSDLW